MAAAGCSKYSGNGSARSWCTNAASLHKSRNLQRHLPKQDRKAAHHQLKTALEQASYADARQMLRELEAWLRSNNESAADLLLEAVEELLTLHRLRVPALLRKTLVSTNPIESMFSLVRYSESQLKRVKGYAGIAQVIATIEAVHAEPQLVQTKKAVRDNHGSCSGFFNGLIDNFALRAAVC